MTADAPSPEPASGRRLANLLVASVVQLGATTALRFAFVPPTGFWSLVTSPWSLVAFPTIGLGFALMFWWGLVARNAFAKGGNPRHGVLAMLLLPNQALATGCLVVAPFLGE